MRGYLTTLVLVSVVSLGVTLQGQRQLFPAAGNLPFSAAAKGDGLIYVAGTIVAQGDIKAQTKAVLITVVWSGVVSFIAFKVVDLTVGLRVTEEQEREGLDISSHGETAYNR